MTITLALIAVGVAAFALGVIATQAVNHAYDSHPDRKTEEANRIAPVIFDALWDYERAAEVPLHPNLNFDDQRALAVVKAVTGVELPAVPSPDFTPEQHAEAIRLQNDWTA